MKKITPVLLAGGSEQGYGHFPAISHIKTLFLRLISSKEVDFSEHITLTNSDYRFIIVEQFQEVGIDPGPVIIEPESKNTAPAILAACIYAIEKDPDAILLVAPSDHIIPNVKSFHKAIAAAQLSVEKGKIVTFGIA